MRLTHDSDYCRRREAEARAAASRKGDSETVRIAGDLALAYATLARRRRQLDEKSAPAEPAALEAEQILLQD